MLQVIASAGQELTVMRNEGDGTWERGSIVDAAVYSRQAVCQDILFSP
jgi:hypothetical protein